MQSPSNDTPTESFLEYNQGKLTVREGHVFLTSLGWDEYRDCFAAAQLTLTDGLPLARFKEGVRAGARARLIENNRALAEVGTRLDTPLEDKRFIRTLLSDKPFGESPEDSVCAKSGQVIAFPMAK